jgi:chromosome segregation ATPase
MNNTEEYVKLSLENYEELKSQLEYLSKCNDDLKESFAFIKESYSSYHKTRTIYLKKDMDLVNDYEEEIEALKKVHKDTIDRRDFIIHDIQGDVKDCKSDIEYYDNKLKEYEKIPKWIVRLFN